MAKINIRDRNKGTGRKPNWEYRFEVAKCEGKRQNISKSGFKTKRDAEIAGSKAFTEYNNAGLRFEPSEIGFNDYMDYWYKQYCITNLKYSTLTSYTAAIEKHLKPRFGKYKIKTLSPSVLQDYANDLVRQKLSSSYIFTILSILKASLDYAVFPLKYIASNPITCIRYPAKTNMKHVRDIISIEDFNRILKRFPAGTRFHMPLLLGWYCGLRISEAVAVTWEDIDFDKKLLNINKQLAKRNMSEEKTFRSTFRMTGDNCAWFFSSPKYNSIRSIKLCDILIETLLKERDRQRRAEIEYGEYYTLQFLQTEHDEKGNTIERIVETQGSQDNDLKRVNFVCVGADGTMTTKENLRYQTRVIQKKLNIKFDFHSLRHTHATLLIDGGVSPKVVQQRLGHKNVATTLQVYVKATDNMQQEAVDILDKVMSESIIGKNE